MVARERAEEIAEAKPGEADEHTEQPGLIEVRIFSYVVHPRVRVQQLPRVFVIGDEHDFETALRAFFGQSGEHVVGFVTVEIDGRNSEGFDDLLDDGNLRLQLFGHLGAMRFVFRIDVFAEVVFSGEKRPMTSGTCIG